MTERDPAYLTPGEAAARLAVSTRTLARMVERGDLTAHTLPSGHRRYSREEIDRLLDSGYIEEMA